MIDHPQENFETMMYEDIGLGPGRGAQGCQGPTCGGGEKREEERMMRLLKPGDPCPCCGKPIREGTPAEIICRLSWIQYGLELREALKGADEDEAADN